MKGEESGKKGRAFFSIPVLPRADLRGSSKGVALVAESQAPQANVPFPPLTSLIVISHLPELADARARAVPQYRRGWIAMIYEDRRSGAQAGL